MAIPELQAPEFAGLTYGLKDDEVLVVGLPSGLALELAMRNMMEEWCCTDADQVAASVERCSAMYVSMLHAQTPGGAERR